MYNLVDFIIGVITLGVYTNVWTSQILRKKILQAQALVIVMVFVKLTEMYDLSTARNKMGIIAVRTPTMAYINKKWSGLVRNHKYVRVDHCNVRISCASMLPADPLQIGTSSNQVAPQDMFNPLLYRVVTNDSWEGILNRMYALGVSGNFQSQSKSINGSADGDAFPSSTGEDSSNAYYALLADDSFRKAHPQAGLNVANVKPFVFPILNTWGGMPNADGTNQLAAPSSELPGVSGTGMSAYTESSNASYLKGHAQPMPRIATIVQVSESSTGLSVIPYLGHIPPCYCLAIVTPPSVNTILYYRLVVEWVIEFIDLRSDAMIGLLKSTASVGLASYYSNFWQAPTKLDESEESESGSLECQGVDATLVMEK